jgi:hypothetical protein
VTDRKRAAVTRKHRREQEAMPLLAELIVEQQPDADSVMVERRQRWVAFEQRWRDTRATDWRRARAALALLPADTKAAMLRYWNEHRWLPGDPSYLADAIHRLHTGKLLLVDGQVVPAHVTITAAEAETILPNRKPIAKGWLAQR